MIVAGIDGCPFGWAMIKHDGMAYSFGLFSTLAQLVAEHSDLQRVLIDMPLGLSSEHGLRTIDSRMRRELKGRSSTVFNAPSRPAIEATTYEQAGNENLAIEGKKISKQSWYISKKIKELDVFVQTNPSNIEFVESHPELCFKYLNRNQVLMSNKSTQTGLKERLDLVSRFDPLMTVVFRDFCQETLRKDARRDDIVDALALCLVNKLAGENGMSYLLDDYVEDFEGIPIRIAYYDYEVQGN